jgi:hypothetical protein
VGKKTSVARIYYGNHGRISKISLLWPEFERIESYPTVTAHTITKRICELATAQGRAKRAFEALKEAGDFKPQRYSFEPIPESFTNESYP